MHTCFLLKNRLGGDARVKKEALSLRKAGWDVTILCWEEPGAPASEIWNGISVRRLRFRSAASSSITSHLDASGGNKGMVSRMLSSLRHSRIRKRATDFLRNAVFDIRLFFAALPERAEVLHANDLDTLLPAWAVSRISGARLVYDSHELWLGSARYLRETGTLGRLRDRLVERCLIRRADLVIAVTRGRIGMMKEMYPGIEVALVENCPDPVEELPSSSCLADMLGTGGDVPIVLYQGAISYERGLEHLIEACRILPAGRVRVVMIGPDMTSGILPGMASGDDVRDVLTILPAVPSERLPEVTVSADIGLILFQNSCLNHYYSLPNKLYEYMMAGLPMIASDLPEMSELIGREGCGVLVDPVDPSAIAEAILDLAADLSRCREMGAKGRAAAMARYTWPVQEEVLVSEYAGLKAGRGEKR